MKYSKKSLSVNVSVIIMFACLLLIAGTANAQQAPQIQWQQTYGGSGDDYPGCVIQTADGGYMIGGTTRSTDGDVHGLRINVNGVSEDIWLVKTNAVGDTIWTRTYGGTYLDRFDKIKQTPDGGYIMVCTVESADGDIAGMHGGGFSYAYGFAEDIWVVKLDATGNITWQQCLGGGLDDLGGNVILTPDGGYVVAAYTYSYATWGLSDLWLVKLTGTGNVSWSNSYGGTYFEGGNVVEDQDIAVCITSTPDGGYIAGCATGSTDGEVTGYHYGLFHNIQSLDTWIVKTDSVGNLQWEKSYGGTGNEKPAAIALASGGGYIISGTSTSNDGDVSGHHPIIDSQEYGTDIWVLKINDTGKIIWQKCFGGSNDDEALAMIKTTDSNYLIAGYSRSGDGDVTGIQGLPWVSWWLLKVNEQGMLVWQKTLGGSLNDECYDVKQTADSGYILAGYTRSTNGDVTAPAHGGYDFWMVKLAKDSTTPHPSSVITVGNNTGISVYPTLTSGVVHVDLPAGYEQANVRLIDMTGRQLMAPAMQNGNHFTITIGNGAPAGMYIVQVINGATISNNKVYYTH